MYTGPERRSNTRFCEGHITLCEDIAIVKTTVLNLDKRINGTIDDVKTHINNSRPRNIAIIGVAITIFIFLFNMAVSLGENHRQIQINTEIIKEMQSKK